MRIDPAIAALQRDPALQRQAQRTLIRICEDWRAFPDIEPLADELAAYGAGGALDSYENLSALFRQPGRAPANMLALADMFCQSLAGEPFGQLPFRHSFDGEVASLLLLRGPNAQLVLHAREPGAWQHEQASFSDGTRDEIVLAGRGSGHLVRAPDAPSAPLAIEPVQLQPGNHRALNRRDACLQVTSVERRLVCLRLDRTPASPAPTRHYFRRDGSLQHQSAGSLRTSRQEMMLAILGRMGRAEAVPEMAALAADRQADEALRWQALRECLALDSGAGFAALSRVARDQADPLAAAAGSLRAQLVEAYPQLAAMEQQPCPA